MRLHHGKRKVFRCTASKPFLKVLTCASENGHRDTNMSITDASITRREIIATPVFTPWILSSPDISFKLHLVIEAHPRPQDL